MNPADYFEKRRGTGVLATADKRGRVAIALYARPHIAGDGAVEFIMADRRSRRNLRENPHAAYLFVEKDEGYRGVRLYLTMTGEKKDSPRIESLRRRPAGGRPAAGPRYLVSFRVDRVLPLVGDGHRARGAR